MAHKRKRLSCTEHDAEQEAVEENGGFLKLPPQYRVVGKLGSEGGDANVWLFRVLGTHSDMVVIKAVRGLQPPPRSRLRNTVDQSAQRQMLTALVPPPALPDSTEVVHTVIQNEAEMLHMLLKAGVPGIVRLRHTELDPRGNVQFIALTYCAGGDLSERLKQQGRFSEKEALQVVRSLASTLQRCHSLGVMHRDVKLSNVFLRCRPAGQSNMSAGVNDEGPDVVLGDFGLACALGTHADKLHQIVGTDRYMAPEVILGGYDELADVWSLGVVLHALLTNTFPFAVRRGRQLPKPSAIRHLILTQELPMSSPSYSHLSLNARQLLADMLRKDPTHRLTMQQVYETCTDILALGSSNPTSNTAGGT